jgi:putative SOS response-associated peptidase YedK
MCGRFARTSSRATVTAEFGITRFAAEDLGPRYNVAPGQRIETIVREGAETQLDRMRWGLAAPPGKPRPINARSETVAGMPLFRDSFGQRRCLIVADGFYEWRKDGARKTPHFIRLRSQRPFAFAGIWSPDPHAADGAQPTCAILTCPPNALLAEIHNRMPVILPAESRDRWLDPASVTKDLRSLLVPFSAAEMEAFPVSTYVNSARNDGPACLRPRASGD